MDLSNEELAHLTAAALLMRNEAREAPTLQDICMIRIAENESYFCKQKENPLNNLPKLMIRDFLNFIHTAGKEKRKFVSKVYLDFILLLLTDKSTDFDFKMLTHFINPENEPFEKIKMATVALHHLKKNCTNIKWLRMYWPRNFQLHLPWHNLTQWKELRFLGVKDFICDSRTLCVILKNHPSLEGLELAILHEELNSECVGFFSEMKSLQYLYMMVTTPREYNDPRLCHIPTVMVNIAAKVPNLATLHFRYAVNYYPISYPDGFVEKYSTICRNPNKEIKLLSLELEKLECSWPNNLSVEKLLISGLDLEMATIKHLETAVPHAKVKSLVFTETKTGNIYKLLRIFGPSITQLGIHYHFPKGLNRNLNLFKIVSLCPNLEKLYMDEFASQEMDQSCILSPKTFTNWRTFSIYKHRYEHIYVTERKILCQVFKMFLLGSKNMDSTLHVFIGEMLRAVEEALEADPDCLKDLKNLHMDVQWTSQLGTMMKVGRMVMQRAPFLEKIKIGTADGVSDHTLLQELPGWFFKLAEDLGVYVEIECVNRRPQFSEIYSDFELNEP